MLAGRYSLGDESGWRQDIWLGQDEILGWEVALQQVGPADPEAGYLARAEREARRVARLQHPRMVRVLDVVLDDETQAYWLVSEPADGITLSDLVRSRGRLIVKEAAALTHQAADALAAAHAAGIVHGDVGPANVLVDGLGRVKVTDFGIVRVPLDSTPDPTGAGSASRAFLAPEVVAGGARDDASDVWSLGATVLYSLSGRSPHELGVHLSGAQDSAGLSGLLDAGALTPLLQATLTADPEQRWPMARVRDHLAESSAVVARRMPTLLSRPTLWQAAEAVPTAPPAAAVKRRPAFLTPSRGVLVAVLAAFVAAVATGMTMFGGGFDSETASSPTAAQPPAASSSPELPMSTPYDAATFRPTSAPSGKASVHAARAPAKVAATRPTSSPSSSPTAFSSSSSGGQDSSSGSSSGSHSQGSPRPPQSPRPTPLPQLPQLPQLPNPDPLPDLPPIDPPPIDPPPIDPPPIDPPPLPLGR